MAYLGRQPVIGNFVKLDAITAVNGQAAYTMQNGSVNFTDYSTVNQFLISLNGTIQSPGSSFTVSGSTLTFASNLSTGDVIDFIMVFGNSLSAGTPTDGTVTTAKLADSSVSLAKLTATGTKDSTTFLRGDNTFGNGGLIKKISVTEGITAQYSGLTGSVVTDHTLTAYNVTHTALSTSNKLAFFISIPYTNSGAYVGITGLKINDGSSDIASGLYYSYNGGTARGEISIVAEKFDITPASTSAITYTLIASVYRPSGSNTVTIGLSGSPGRIMVMEYGVNS